MNRKPPPKPPPSPRNPAARAAAAASAAQRKSAPAPARRAAPVAKAPEPHKKGAPAPKLTAAQEKAAASHKSNSHPAAAHAEPRRVNGLPEDRQSQLKLLIARGKEQGYLTSAQVNDHLPAEIVDPEQIEGIVNTINDMGIPVYEKAPDTESLLASEPSSPADDEAIEEAAA